MTIPSLASVSTLQREGWLSSSGSCQGAFSISCHQSTVWCLQSCLLTPALLMIYSPEWGPGVEIPSESQKQEAHPSNLGPRARKEYVASDTTPTTFPLCQSCIPWPGTSCDTGAPLNLFPSRGNDYLQEVISLPSTHPKMEKLLNFH